MCRMHPELCKEVSNSGLAALVPRPRLHLIRFHGVLAPNAKLRAMVVPQEPDVAAQEAKPASARRSARITARCG